MARLGLFPEVEPYDSGFLKVDDTHTVCATSLND
jgi:hypothetical protein